MNLLIRIVPVFCMCWTAYGATSSYTSGTTTLTINGVPSGPVYRAEGGDPHATVLVAAPAGTALPKKRIGSVGYDPITLVVAFPLAPPLLEWVKDMCRNQNSRRTLILSEYDLNYNLRGIPLEASNALLTEVRFPSFDAASKDASRVTLIFQPQSTKPSTAAIPATLSSAARQTAAVASGFRISIAGLLTTRVSQIEAFTIKQSSETVPPEFSNLSLTIASADAASWNAWRDTFIVNGKNDDANEKSGTLELLSTATATAGAQVLMSFQFDHVGIIRTRKSPTTAGTDSVPRFQADLYYETLTLGGPAPLPLTAVTTVAPVTVAGATLPNSVVTPPSTPAPIASKGIVSDTGDQGGRDPRDFPRLEGTVRKSYSSVQQRTSLQEMVVYKSPELLDALEKSYTTILTAAGWEFLTRVENNDAVGKMHQIILNWKSGLRTAAVTLTEVKAAGSEISVNLTTKI